MKFLFSCLLCVLFILNAEAKPLKVVASFSILGNLIQEIGGNKISLITIVGPDSDAHIYEPKPQDAKNILEADLVFVNGLGFEEGWIQRLLKLSPKTPVIIASHSITPRQASRENNGVPDPHAWHNVQHARVYAINITKALMHADPKHARHFKHNHKILDKALQDLDDWAIELFKQIPTERRMMVTSHDAFSYFAEHYGIEEWSLMGISTDAEASAQDFKNLIDTINKRHIRSVFLENITSPKLMKQIAKDTHITLGGTLYSDALSVPGGPADTYIKMILHNVQAIYNAMK